MLSGYDGMEKLNNETRKLKGYIYRGLTQHSFLQNNIDETTSYYAKIKERKVAKLIMSLRLGGQCKIDLLFIRLVLVNRNLEVI